jgi:hypothetical protein
MASGIQRWQIAVSVKKIKTPLPSHVKMIAALLACYSRVASDQEERYGEG